MITCKPALGKVPPLPPIQHLQHAARDPPFSIRPGLPGVLNAGLAGASHAFKSSATSWASFLWRHAAMQAAW
jgi:hypothetical protein